MRYTVEKVEKLRTFFVLTGFPNSLRFQNNFRNTKLSFRQFVRFGTFFCRHFQTARRIDANDTPLESYGKFASFLSLANFPNSLWFLINFKNTKDSETKRHIVMNFLFIRPLTSV